MKRDYSMFGRTLNIGDCVAVLDYGVVCIGTIVSEGDRGYWVEFTRALMSDERFKEIAMQSELLQFEAAQLWHYGEHNPPVQLELL